MDTQSELETTLREALATSVSRAEVRGDIGQSALRAGVRARSKRRNRIIGFSMAATVVAVSAGVVSAVSRDQRISPPEIGEVRAGGSAPSPVGMEVDVARWVDRLPSSPLPDISYQVGATFRGRSRVYNVDKGATLIGATANGWLFLHEHDETVSGGSFTSSISLLHADGGWTDVPVPQQFNVQDEAISPDGQRLAIGNSVIDLTSGTTVASLPDNAAVILGWTTSGIVYADNNNAGYLWQAQGTAKSLGVNVSRVFTRVDMALITQSNDDCIALVRLSLTIPVAVLASGCGLKRPALVSPDGTAMIRADGTFTTIASGTVTDRGALPSELNFASPHGAPTIVESAPAVGYATDSLLFALKHSPPGSTASEARLVNCKFTTASCSKVGITLTADKESRIRLPAAREQ